MSSSDRTAFAPLRPTARYIPEGWALQLAACIPAHSFSLLLCVYFRSLFFSAVLCYLEPPNFLNRLCWTNVKVCVAECKSRNEVPQWPWTNWCHTLTHLLPMMFQKAECISYCKLNALFSSCIIGIQQSVSSLGFRDMFTHTESSLMQMDYWLCRWVV